MLLVYTDKHIFVVSVYTDVTDVFGTGMLLYCSSPYFDDNSIAQACVPNLAIVSGHSPPYLQTKYYTRNLSCSRLTKPAADQNPA